MKGHADAALALMTAGAKVHVSTAKAVTPLHFAVQSGA